MLMKKSQILIPKPSSRFLLARCKNCNTERIIYSHTTKVIRCKNCNELLAEPRGGKAEIYAEVIKRLDNP